MGDLKQVFFNKQVSELQMISNAVPFISEGKAMFYAGWECGNWDRAARYAKNNSMAPITETRGGKLLDHLSQDDGMKSALGKRNAMRVWDFASRNYASLIKGEVKTFIAGADKLSTFRRVELATILNNKNVTKINGMDRAKLDQFRRQTFARLRNRGMGRKEAAEQSKTATHRKVAIAELRQDSVRAKATKDWSLHIDVKLRLDALKKQSRSEVVRAAQDKQIAKHQQSRQEFQQVRKEKISQLRQEKRSARQTGDMKSVIAAQKNRTAVVKELRSENSRHTLQARTDQAIIKSRLPQQVRVQTQANANVLSSANKTQQNKEPAYQAVRVARKVQERPKVEAQSTVQVQAKEQIRTQDKAQIQTKALDQKQVQAQAKSQIPTQDRMKAIQDRAQQAALKRGASIEVAKSAGEMRVSHVQAKMELNKERVAVQQRPTYKAADPYVSKAVDFREKRIADLQTQARQENRTYKGSPQQSEASRQTQKKYESIALVSRSTLTNRFNAGELSVRDHAQMSKSLETKLAETKEKHAAQAQIEAQAQAQAQARTQIQAQTQKTTQSPTTTGYSIPAAANSFNHASQTSAQSQDQSMGHGHGGVARSHGMRH